MAHPCGTYQAAENEFFSSLLVIGFGFAPVAGAGADMPEQPAPALRQVVLEDFDNAARSAGWHAFTSDRSSRIELRLVPSPDTATGGGALRLHYAFTGAEAAFAGLRIDLGSVDATAYDQLVFRVRGDPADGYAPDFKVEFRRPDAAVGGLYEKGSYVVRGVAGTWREIAVPLNFMTGIQDWTRISELVILMQSRRSAIKQGTYYLDDFRLVKTGARGPGVRDRVMPVRKKAWEESLGGQTAARPYVRRRLMGWPAHLLVDKGSLPATDRDFLWRLARDTWRGLRALTDRDNGLPIDNVHFHDRSVAVTSARIGDYTSITNVGLYLIATVAAHDLGFVGDGEAGAMLAKLLTTLEGLETYRGFYYNYYDTTSLERTSNFISFVDSSWLTAGLMVVRSRVPDLRERCSRLIGQTDYRFFYDDVEQHMMHGYYVNLPAAAEYRYGLLYTESRLGSLIAIGKGDVPEEHWFGLLRTFPDDYTWQTQKPRARTKKGVHGHRLTGGYYEWRGMKFVPSWGGSLFEALMPTLVLDEKRYAPRSLGANDAAHAEVQRRYALEELRYPVWGLSPSSTPAADDGYSEYGVKVLGARGYKAGAVTPHASALALAVAPQAAANLRELARRYDIYGEYGFYDAVDPVSGAVSHSYLALDQAMTFIALANRLKPHCIQDAFAADPIAARALSIIADEKFFE